MRLPFVASICLIAAVSASAAATVVDPLASLRREHPRLLLTDEQLALNLAVAKSDPLHGAFHAYLLQVAEKELLESPIEYTLIGPRLLEESRKAMRLILTAAMAYRLTGDSRFSAAATQTMLRAAAFKDWNPNHFLDTAEMAFALAVGYDWLYAQLTAGERATIKRALMDKALVFAKPAYARAGSKWDSFPFVGNNLTNNWNQVCNAGFVLAALALAEDEPELARSVIAGLRDTLPHAMAAYQPDGAYPEGPVYWAYGTHFTIYTLAALETALGQDFGLSKAAGFDRTVLYRVHVTGPTGVSFNYADGFASELGADDAITWLAQRFPYPYALAANRAWLGAPGIKDPDREVSRFLAFHAAWFPKSPQLSERPSLDARFGGPAAIASFRTAWDDRDALWVGFKAGNNRVNHSHLDLGSFVIEADGERWAMDLGRDDYNLPGYWEGAHVDSPRWRYYRLNNLSHNTLTLGGRLQSPDAQCPLTAYASTPAHAFAIADLTSAYSNAARRVRRGIALRDRTRVVVQDEIEGLAAGEAATWRLLTGASIHETDERVVTLSQNGRSFRVEILAPREARFTWHAAHPPTAAEKANAGISVLEATIPPRSTESNTTLTVLLTPLGPKWSALPKPALLPLDAWR